VNEGFCIRGRRFYASSTFSLPRSYREEEGKIPFLSTPPPFSALPILSFLQFEEETKFDRSTLSDFLRRFRKAASASYILSTVLQLGSCPICASPSTEGEPAKRFSPPPPLRVFTYQSPEFSSPTRYTSSGFLPSTEILGTVTGPF